MYHKTLQNVLVLSLGGLYAHAQTFTIPSQPLGTTWQYLNPSVVGTNSQGSTTLRFDQVAPPQGSLTTTQTIGRTVLVNGDHYVESNSAFTLDCTIPSNSGNSFTCADAFVVGTTVNGKASQGESTNPITFGATTVVISQGNTGSVPTATSGSGSGQNSVTLGPNVTPSPTASQPRIGTGDVSPTQSSGNSSLPAQSGGNSTSPTGGTSQLKVSISYLGFIVTLSALSTI